MATNANEKGKFSLKGIKDGITRTFRDMRGEMRKVVWPTKKQAINNTAVVLAFMLVMSVFIGLFDSVLTLILSLFFGRAA